MTGYKSNLNSDYTCIIIKDSIGGNINCTDYDNLQRKGNSLGFRGKRI